MSIKLVVVAGPSKGATYFLKDGESSIGRAEGNEIVLASTQVSKRHVVLAINGDKVELTDAGSSNGTFVNGILVKQRRLQSRDKISVGPFVLEVIVQAVANRAAGLPVATEMGGNLVSEPLSNTAQIEMEQSLRAAQDQPKSILMRWKNKFDEVVLPVLHDFHEKQETLTIMVALFVVFVVLNIGFTIFPILEQSREEVLREAENHAKYIATQIEILNRNSIIDGRESLLNVDFAETELNIREAVIVSLDGRIMAPANRLNESYNQTKFLQVRDRMQRDPGSWRVHKFRTDSEVVVIHPIMVFSKSKQINVPGALAIVVLNTAGIRLDSGTIGVIYFEALSTSVILGGILIYLIYALTQRPITHLNSEIDQALRGDIEELSKRYRNEEVDHLVDSINSLISRIPKSSGTDETNMAAGIDEQQVAENLLRSIDAIVLKFTTPAILLDSDYRIRRANPAFEELTGIRSEGAVGELIESVSRDEALPALLREVGEKAKMGIEGVSEEYEFPSGFFKISGTAFSGVPGRPNGILYLMEKAEG